MRSVRHILSAVTMLGMVFLCSFVFAESGNLSPGDFLNQVLAMIGTLGGLPWVLKVAGIIVVLISSMKVSVLNQYFWSKLGSFQAWVAPILGLIAGMLSLQPITLPGVLAYVSAGAGAIILHELLDSIKAIPGIGNTWVAIITTIEMILHGPAAQTSSTVQLGKKA